MSAISNSTNHSDRYCPVCTVLLPNIFSVDGFAFTVLYHVFTGLVEGFLSLFELTSLVYWTLSRTVIEVKRANFQTAEYSVVKYSCRCLDLCRFLCGAH